MYVIYLSFILEKKLKVCLTTVLRFQPPRYRRKSNISVGEEVSQSIHCFYMAPQLCGQRQKQGPQRTFLNPSEGSPESPQVEKA
jgi:hypothetical protein